MKSTKAPRRHDPAATRERKAKQAEEGLIARKEYEANLVRERENLARLRALRLAREASQAQQTVPAKNSVGARS